MAEKAVGKTVEKHGPQVRPKSAAQKRCPKALPKSAAEKLVANQRFSKVTFAFPLGRVGWSAARKCARDFVFTHRSFLRNMALSHAIPSGIIAAPSGWVWLDSLFRLPPARAPINMTDQNRASASSVPYRLFDPVL
ncbi:hypothetical protein [Paraburkholderia ribeironis]|uniref:hypothetical protein n=1 Tax=Paraburkholderia ribeironis TaxID=1247936 RepID=UPI001177ACB5|nr:hypothetical protein [Paraburkholderia ribeironis]